MASKEKHLNKAEHNEEFFGLFERDKTPYLDWVVTGIFYSALHYLRAVASKFNFTNISSYGEMDHLFDRVQTFKKNPDIYLAYRQLKDDSREARYEMRSFSVTEIEDLIKDEFSQIKAFAKQNLS